MIHLLIDSFLNMLILILHLNGFHATSSQILALPGLWQNSDKQQVTIGQVNIQVLYCL